MNTHQILTILVVDTGVIGCVADSLQECRFASISPTDYKDTKASIWLSEVIGITVAHDRGKENAWEPRRAHFWTTSSTVTAVLFLRRQMSIARVLGLTHCQHQEQSMRRGPCQFSKKHDLCPKFQGRITVLVASIYPSLPLPVCIWHYWFFGSCMNI